MARDLALSSGPDDRIFKSPWPALGIGLALTAASALWYLIFKTFIVPVAFAGSLAAGAGVAIRPKSALVLGLAACSGLLGWSGLGGNPEGSVADWDSARGAVLVLTGIAVLAAVLLCLPRLVRRLVISLLVVFHFVGIMTAATSVPPNPVLSTVLWAHVYRPYLEFFYLVNAYHFYSPDPGPGTLVWFYVIYEDGTEQEYILPDHDKNMPALEYQRYISLAESGINQKSNVPMESGKWERRLRAGDRDRIGVYPGVSAELQYREPTPWYSKRILESYARYVARNVPHPTDAAKKVISVKVYLVIHNILSPKEIVDDIGPETKSLYMPYFMGEFDADGKLKDPNDPYLYWLIPILPKQVAVRATNSPFSAGIGRQNINGQVEVIDYFEVHKNLKPRRVEPDDDKVP
jgi:hypothetical protein